MFDAVHVAEVELGGPVARVSDDPPALSLVVVATPDAARQARAAIRAFAEGLDLPPAVLRAAELAVGEAAANIVQHAYADDELGTLALDADFQDGTLELVISDTGRGVLLPAADECRFGLPLIAEMTDDFRVAEGCPRGAEVWMRFVVER